MTLILNDDKYLQLQQAPRELQKSSQKAPRELQSPSLGEICVLISLSKTEDKQSFLGSTWQFEYGEQQMVQIPSCVTFVYANYQNKIFRFGIS